MADKTPNELYIGWLKEWMDQAQDRNSKGQLVYALTKGHRLMETNRAQIQESMAVHESM